MGLTYAALAVAKDAQPSQAVEDRQAALEWLQKSLAGWRALQSDLAFAPPQRREMQQVEEALASLGKR